MYEKGDVREGGRTLEYKLCCYGLRKTAQGCARPNFSVLLGMGVSQVWLSKKLGLSPAAVSLSVARGLQIVHQENYEIVNL